MGPLHRSVGIRSLAIAVAVAGLTGCETSPTAADPGPPLTVLSDPAPPPSVEPDPTVNALAEQAERDVADFLRRRDEADEAALASTSPSAVAAPPGRTGGDVVLFNDPPATRIAAAPAPRPASPAAPMFRAEPEAPVPHALGDTPPAPDGAPTTELAPKQLDRLLLDTRRELYRQSAYSDMPLREILMVAAMSLISDEPVLDPGAIDALNDLSDDEKALLERLQAFFHELGTQLDGSASADEVIGTALTELRKEIDQQHLTLGTIALCSRVVGFGDFAPFPRGPENRHGFLAHEEQQVIVYLEIDDFTSSSNPKGEWVTELSQQLTIYSDADGIPVWKADWQTALDRSQKKRRDFFTVQIITLPKTLSVGRYQLKVRVRDDQSGAETEGSVAFEMVADEGMLP